MTYPSPTKDADVMAPAQPWPYTIERFAKEILIEAPVSVWVDYDDVDHDEAKRVAALVASAPTLQAENERLARELERARAALTDAVATLENAARILHVTHKSLSVDLQENADLCSAALTRGDAS